MTGCNLDALQAGSPDAWEPLFDWLWPTAFAAAHSRLGVKFPEEVEDVAIEALEEIARRPAQQVKSLEEFPKLARTIAENHAVSRWRTLTAQKRGAGKIESLDAVRPDGSPHPEPESATPNLDAMDLGELRGLLAELQADLKPELKTALRDFFLDDLSYREISEKRGWPIGSIGVYVRRGLEAIRQQRTHRPNLMKEAKTFLRLLFC